MGVVDTGLMGAYGGCWTVFGAVSWQPTGLMGVVDRLWGCMLATFRSYGGCWAVFGAVCWQPTCLMGVVGPSLGLYVGNLQVLWGLLDPLWGCMLATYRSYGGLWGLLDRLWGCMLATYRSCGGCWTVLGAVSWQPTGLMGVVGPSLGLCVGNLQVLGVVGPSLGLYLGNLQVLWGLLIVFGAVCWQPTGLMGAYGGCWTVSGAVCWQRTGLVGVVGPSLGLYVGNLQVLWGLLDRLWGCMLATYRSCGGCWTVLGAVCWQPTGLMGVVDRLWGCMLATYRSYGGLWGLLDRLWGCMLATYRSCGGCWTVLGAVCWQPTGLMGVVGPSLGLYVGNLQVLWGLLDRPWGCMLATYRSYGGCWTVFGAVCWQPTGLVGVVGPSLGLYVGNLQVLWGLLTVFGAVCWQPTGLMGVVGPSLGLYVGNLQVLWGLLTVFGAVCWQPTGLMGVVGPSLGLYVGNLQVLWGLLDGLWGCMLATYRSYGGCNQTSRWEIFKCQIVHAFPLPCLISRGYLVAHPT